MTPRVLTAVALALVLVLAGCLGAVQGQDTATTDSDDPTIGVAASATVTGEPDLAVVTVAVESTADSADAARQQVATDADAVRAALRDAGLPADAVTTTRFQVQAQYDYSDRTPTLVGYRAAHVLEIEVSEVDRAGEVVDIAVGNGATRVDSVQFTLSDETQTRLHEQALTDAMANARADAETIAAAESLTVTGVQTATTSGSVTPPVPYQSFDARAESGTSTTFSPGDVTVTARVQVTYTGAPN